MNRNFQILFCIGCLGVFSCAVMPADATKEALPDIQFSTLIQQAAQYIGKTVILGGYVVRVQNLKDLTRIVAVEAPLGLGQEPKSKDYSQGRLIILFDGFIDPEVYGKDRKITVAGTLLGSSATEAQKEPFPYVRIRMRHIHLWPVKNPVQQDPYRDYWGYPPFPYPWGWRYPYWR